jgi:hypothetical protein
MVCFDIKHSTRLSRSGFLPDMGKNRVAGTASGTRGWRASMVSSRRSSVWGRYLFLGIVELGSSACATVSRMAKQADRSCAWTGFARVATCRQAEGIGGQKLSSPHCSSRRRTRPTSCTEEESRLLTGQPRLNVWPLRPPVISHSSTLPFCTADRSHRNNLEDKYASDCRLNIPR